MPTEFVLGGTAQQARLFIRKNGLEHAQVLYKREQLLGMHGAKLHLVGQYIYNPVLAEITAEIAIRQIEVVKHED